jgi:uncharacterized membrane protein
MYPMLHLRREAAVLEVTEFIAIFCAMLFTGAAIYISLAEHPARMACGTELAATEWVPSYKRATKMQVPLAVISTIASLVSWRLTENILWLVGAFLIFAVIPFTLIAIRPTNELLLYAARDRASVETRALLEKWGKLHTVRSILSLLASAVLLVAILHIN